MKFYSYSGINGIGSSRKYPYPYHAFGIPDSFTPLSFGIPEVFSTPSEFPIQSTNLPEIFFFQPLKKCSVIYILKTLLLRILASIVLILNLPAILFVCNLVLTAIRVPSFVKFSLER